MDQDRLLLTNNVRKLPSTGIQAIDDVHNFVYDLRKSGKPCLSVKLKPLHYYKYAFWVSKQVGPEKVYGPTGEVAAPLTVDGIGIECGSPTQAAYILPHYLPMDHKGADKYRKFKDDFGQLPEHHSQIN